MSVPVPPRQEPNPPPRKSAPAGDGSSGSNRPVATRRRNELIIGLLVGLLWGVKDLLGKWNDDPDFADPAFAFGYLSAGVVIGGVVGLLIGHAAEKKRHPPKRDHGGAG